MKRLLATIVLAGAALGVGAAPAGAASGQDCYPSCNSTATNQLSGTSPTETAATTTSSLAFTGTDIAATSAAGVVLVAGGAILVGVGRRRRNAA